MRKKIRIFIVYFPVILVAGQVLVNLLSFVVPSVYIKCAFYLNTFFGTNVFFSLFLVAFTLMFKFCSVSKWAAGAECLFAINYMIVQVDSLYNILFQVIVGSVAIAITFSQYVKMFPLCRLGLIVNFIKSVIRTGSCSLGLVKWEHDLKNTITKRHEKRRP